MRGFLEYCWAFFSRSSFPSIRRKRPLHQGWLPSQAYLESSSSSIVSCFIVLPACSPTVKMNSSGSDGGAGGWDLGDSGGDAGSLLPALAARAEPRGCDLRLLRECLSLCLLGGVLDSALSA